MSNGPRGTTRSRSAPATLLGRTANYLRRRLMRRTPPDPMRARPAPARLDSSAVLVDGSELTPATAPFVWTPFTAPAVVCDPFIDGPLWNPATVLGVVVAVPLLLFTMVALFALLLFALFCAPAT